MREFDPSEHAEGCRGQRETQDLRQRNGNTANIHRAKREVRRATTVLVPPVLLLLLLLLLRRIATIARCGLLLQTEYRGLCFCLLVLVTLVSSAKTDDRIELPFEWVTRFGPRNHVLDRGPGSPKGRGNFWGCTAH